MTHNLIRLAQYSLLHHSINLLLVSRPTSPPSASPPSLIAEFTEGAGDGILDGAALALGVKNPLPLPLTVDSAATLFLSAASAAFASLPTLVKLSLFPLPNLFQTCPSLVKCLLSWKILQTSFWWFFLCSESTALSSRTVHEGAKSGEWKKPEKREMAPGRAEGATLK